MSSRLADRLKAARRRRFVGRASEVALFRAALGADELPFFVLHVFGPGGVGKTSLLHEFIASCRQVQTPATYLDGREVEPSPEAFFNGLRGATGVGPADSPLAFLAEQRQRHVLLIDTYETLAPLDHWLRTEFLPQLPDEVCIVLAGRHPPSLEWRTDPGWQSLVQLISLRNLSPEESRTYLTEGQIPPEQHQAVLDFTHGHPLALSLVTDVFAQHRDEIHDFAIEAVPDVIRMLLQRLVENVPGPAHRTALEASAMVRVTTEALLAEMLALPDANELFVWMHGLSFTEPRRVGLAPHDLVREALVADLRWRNPDWYAELHRRARTFYADHLQQTSGHGQQRLLFDYIFLHRDNQMVRPFFQWQASGGTMADSLLERDLPTLTAMISAHEGQESARLAVQWLERQPESVLVFRDAEGQPAGLLMTIALDRASNDILVADPATQTARNFLERHGPLRPGERATYFRFWLDRDTYQAISPIQSLIGVNMVRHYLTTPGLAYTFFPCADPDFWAPLCAYANLARIPEADFEVDGRRYGLYGHDWRTEPPVAWLALLAEREIAASPQTVSPPSLAEPLVVLSRPDFELAIRQALRDLGQPDSLRHNPLLRSRLIDERAGHDAATAARTAALQSLLKDAAETLRDSPRELKFYRALYHTYLQPAPTQEKAAELLDLPFSTFRRHLKTAITRVTELLWQQEIGEASK
jgi:hypothetical protein